MSPAGWDDVVAIAKRYPGVEETTSHGRPSLKVGRKFIAAHRSNPDALVIKTTDMQEREALLASRPDVFFTTPHYDGYPAAVARPPRPDRDRAARGARRGRVAHARAQEAPSQSTRADHARRRYPVRNSRRLSRKSAAVAIVRKSSDSGTFASSNPRNP